MKTLYLLAYLTSIIILSCNESSDNVASSKLSASLKEDVIACPPGTSLLEMQKIVQTAGKYGHTTAVPITEFKIIADGFNIVPLSGLGSWSAFAPSPDSARMIGDLIIPETHLATVQQEVIEKGLTITDIHKYATRNRTIIVYMHVTGSGDGTRLSNNSQALFTKLKQIDGINQEEIKADTVVTNLSLNLLDSIIGYKGKVEGDIYKYTIGRPEVLKAHGIPVGRFLGFDTWTAWQGTDEKAVVAGDFTMLETEVGPVLQALAENGFEGVTVHNHLVHEEPGIFILHFWGVGKAETLAQGLRAALDQQSKK